MLLRFAVILGAICSLSAMPTAERKLATRDFGSIQVGPPEPNAQVSGTPYDIVGLGNSWQLQTLIAESLQNVAQTASVDSTYQYCYPDPSSYTLQSDYTVIAFYVGNSGNAAAFESWQNNMQNWNNAYDNAHYLREQILDENYSWEAACGEPFDNVGWAGMIGVVVTSTTGSECNYDFTQICTN